MIRALIACLLTMGLAGPVLGQSVLAVPPTVYISDLDSANSFINSVIIPLCSDLNSSAGGSCKTSFIFPPDVIGEDAGCIDESPVDFSDVEYDFSQSGNPPNYTNYVYYGIVQTCNKSVSLEASVNGTWTYLGDVGANQGTQVINVLCQGSSSTDCVGIDTVDAIRACDTYTGADCNGTTGTSATLVVQENGNGTVSSSPSGINCGNACQASFSVGTNVALTAAPNSGYKFNGWGGVCSGNSTTCQVVMDADKAVSASFVQSSVQTFTVTPVANAGGSITPSTPQQVTQGATTSFAVEPNGGYQIASVAGCGGSLNGNVYTTGTISANCTVTASFKQSTAQTFTVTPVAGAGGTLNPSTPQQVAQGATVSFTITPDSGYFISVVSGCNGTLSGNNYATGAIVADCTVSAIFSKSASDASGNITTIIGNGQAGYSGDGARAINAELDGPEGLAIDSAGNLFIADTGNDRIRKVTLDGIISTVAGNGTYGYSGDGDTAIRAELNGPTDVAVDSIGDLYIADSLNSRVRKVTPNGIISTVAGGGVGIPGDNGDGGQAISAYLNLPRGVAVDTYGNLYIADTGESLIREVNSNGVIQTIAGTGDFKCCGDGGLATNAALNFPSDIAIDASGVIYIADEANERIRKITSDGIITTVAGNGIAGYAGDGELATNGWLNGPVTILVDLSHNVYFSDMSNNRVRTITPSGDLATIAGNGVSGYSGEGQSAISAELAAPYGLAMDSAGDIYIADSQNNRIRKVASVSASTNLNLDQHGITGSWYNPATSGQGLEIEVYPDGVAQGTGLLFAGWFTYDVTAAGGRRWYVLSGN